jgi:hypothetical protein
MSRQCGADGFIFTWEALRPFAKELAADIKACGRDQRARAVLRELRRPADRAR